MPKLHLQYQIYNAIAVVQFTTNLIEFPVNSRPNFDRPNSENQYVSIRY